jgi:hypothetical protein
MQAKIYVTIGRSSSHLICSALSQRYTILRLNKQIPQLLNGMLVPRLIQAKVFDVGLGIECVSQGTAAAGSHH